MTPPAMVPPAVGAPRMGLAVVASLLALGYAVAVVAVTWSAADKGFVAFTGRRVVEVTSGGVADQAGVRRDDVITAIDGKPVLSTLDYAARLLSRAPGEQVTLTLARDGAVLDVPLLLRPSPTPWPALAALVLAAVLLVLGLAARRGRPGDAARRFWRTTAVYAVVYCGALSWSHLVVHPLLAGVFLVAMFFAPALAMDFAVTFPTAPSPRTVRRYRLIGYGPVLALLAGTTALLGVAVMDARAGRAGDVALAWAVRLIAVSLAFGNLAIATGLVAQFRRMREASGAERGQLKWLLFGFSLSTLPAFLAVPVAAADLDHFLLVGYQPFVVAVSILWFLAATLAVLRVRLADVDAVIHRSLVYALATTLAALIYVGVVLGVGVVAEQLVGASRLAPHLIAAVAAAAMYGPIRGRVTSWLDRRFFRDRLHYVQALRELSETATRLREPRDLAREVVERAVAALRAEGGALFVAGEGGQLELAHAQGLVAPTPEPPENGVAAPIRRNDRTEGLLVLGPRRGGDLYAREDRDLLGALAGQLAVALDNARAFGTIAGMSRTLEEQNREIRELRDRLEDENRYLKGKLDARSDGSIVGGSRPIRELLKQIERVAPTEAVVLITGESGTGKGLIARAIHAASPRADRPFIHVDGGAIPAGIFESELFGHERGAFTGAVRNRRGHFELADGGTLFFDEIGEVPLALQPKLLRILQERSFLRVGGSKQVDVDVRLIAATNRNLDEMVARGEFREDLYYRLRVVELIAPPLRARRGDIPALVESLLPRLCKRNHRPPRVISDEAMDRLTSYAWPGNVRELENVLERAVVLCEGSVIRDPDLGLPETPPIPEVDVAAVAGEPDAGHGEVMESIEKARLIAALRAHGGNQSHAARALGIPRTTLINKLRRFGLL